MFNPYPTLCHSLSSDVIMCHNIYSQTLIIRQDHAVIPKGAVAATAAFIRTPGVRLGIDQKSYEEIKGNRWIRYRAHGTRTCIKRKKIIYGKFFDFCAENVSRIRF